MLLDYLTDYCWEKFVDLDKINCGNNCSHPEECPGDCKQCLDQIHFPREHSNPRLEYDCLKLLSFYVCRYSYKYCSEIEYALDIISNYIKNFGSYNIISIGCGAAPDLMAIEAYTYSKKIQKTMYYWGFDKNDSWNPIHAEIENYCNQQKINVKFFNNDVITYFKDNSIKNMNILVMQYVISHFYNNESIKYINEFFEYLINNLISIMHDKSVIIINDVNSCYRGRNYFNVLLTKLKRKYEKIYPIKRYFEGNHIQSDAQRYGEPHMSNALFYPVPRYLYRFIDNNECRSAQLIIILEK